MVAEAGEAVHVTAQHWLTVAQIIESSWALYSIDPELHQDHEVTEVIGS